MDKIILGLLVITCVFLTTYGDNYIKKVYFDPATSIMPDKKDGVVIVELINGTLSTICMTSANDNKNAKVICRTMQYTTGNIADSYSIISSKTSTIGSALFQSIACQGNEGSLEGCSGFVAGTGNFLCSNHNMDLHVYCTGTYEYTPTVGSVTGCNGNLSDGTQGLLRITTAGVSAYVCGINRNFGPLEAEYFCKNTLCIKSNYSRIIEGYKSNNVIREIGGFNNMTCNATTCINVYPFQSDRCTPETNIGVICTNDSITAYVGPIVNCSSTAMNITWDPITFNATIANNFIAIQNSNGSNCTGINVPASVKSPVTLSVKYGECNMMTLGTKEDIIFVFRVIRMYPKVNNIIRFPDESFNVSCTITRNQTVSQGPLEVDPVALPPSSGNTSIPNILQLFLDANFATEITNQVTVAAGTRIFVRVSLINPPADLILVLDTCFYGPSNLQLIVNRCPTATDVQITIRSAEIKSFSFTLTQALVAGQSSVVTCLTSKCSTSEPSCKTQCGS